MKKLTSIIISIVALSGCAQDVGDIDRTQPNRIKKSLFEGEWYHQKTVFDVPYTAAFTFTGETYEVDRVRWQIEEGFLIGYRSYDLVENTLSPTQLDGVKFRGAPIAAYAILSHFDVIREYNAQTGEETNVIYENVTDRPWYEREYFRVDWSKNLVFNFNFILDDLEQSPIAYYVQDRTDSDRLLIGVKNGDDWTDTQDWDEIAKLESADYLDIVDTVFVNPQEIDFGDGSGSYPACWYYYRQYDCQPDRVKVRSSFVKIDETEQYEALAYPDNAVARDGNGDAIRDAAGDAVRVPWFDKFGYFRIERDNYDRQRPITETGRTYLITRWGIYKDAPACKQGDSYAGCTVRPIVYYLSPGFPETLIPAARRTVAQWNDALKQVVNQQKYGGSRSLDEVEDVFVLRANTFVAGQNLGERIGDLRYSFLYYVHEPTQVGLYGYGPSGADPLTGRIINGTAYVYGAPLEAWATTGADVVALINGQIDTDELIEGEDVREYVARVRGDYAGRASQMSVESAKRFARSKHVKQGRQKQRALGKRRMRLDRGKVRAKLSAIRDTPFEERLLNDELIRAMKPETRGQGNNLAAALSPAERARISPANWGSSGARRAREQKRRLKLRKRNVLLSRNLDGAVIGLAESLRGETDRERVRQHILERVFASTAEHEVGHTLGLRHNFGGSYDALNYPPRYWELRGNTPQPFEAFTPDQLAQGIREQQYSSIMDYSARFSLDIQGIGNYDRAAIHFGYGELVQIFQPESAPQDPLAEAFGLPYALQEMRHYTSLPRLFGGNAANMYQRQLLPYRSMVAQMTGQAQTNHIEVPFRFCSDEYDGALRWCNTYDEGPDPYEIVRNASDAYEDYYFFNAFARDNFLNLDPFDYQGRVYAYYMAFVQLEYQHWVFRGFDEASTYESLRGDAAAWGIEDVPWDQSIDGGLSGAAASRLGVNFLARVIQAPEPGAYYIDPDDNVFYNYSYDTDQPLCPPGQSLSDCSDLNVPLGPGKYAFSLFSPDGGYYFYDRIHVVGSFYDKLAALEALTLSDTTFLGVDANADLTQFAIGMYLFFPNEVARLVGGSAVETYSEFAGRVDLQSQAYSPRDMFAAPETFNGTASVDPSTSFTVELYATWYGMAFLNSNFDNSFNDLMRIYVEGNGEGLIPSVTDQDRIGTFVHPRTGRTFTAIRHENPSVYSPGFELVTRTQRQAVNPNLDPQARDFLIESSVAIMETIRGLSELYGKLYF